MNEKFREKNAKKGNFNTQMEFRKKSNIIGGKMSGQVKLEKKRCFGNDPQKKFYADYHDSEWGIPCHDDQHLFEMLILEGARAGLSWETILKRREGYRKAFHHFDPKKVANQDQQELLQIVIDRKLIILLKNPDRLELI